LKGKFGRIILDEAYKIRNPQTKTAESIRQLFPNVAEEELAQVVVHLITATPMMNRGSDFYGYQTMFWRELFHASPEESFGDFAFGYYDDGHIPQCTPVYPEGGLLDYKNYRIPTLHNILWLSFPMVSCRDYSFGKELKFQKTSLHLLMPALS
jgi:hypothetical protein